MHFGRITQTPEGPSVRDLNIKVADVLRWLGSGQTETDILAHNPGLAHEDMIAVYLFAAGCIASGQSVRDAFAFINEDIRGKLEAVRSSQSTARGEAFRVPTLTKQ